MTNHSIEAPVQDCDPQEVFRSLGALTRTVHEGLRQLGLDRAIEGAVASLPDARDRLNYIARISGEAAEKVIGQVEGAKNDQNALAAEAERVGALLAGNPVAAVASGELMNFVHSVSDSCVKTDVMLTEILMAQSFHDLSSQVISKVVDLAQNLETELVKLLIEVTPKDKRETLENSWLNGPVVDDRHRASGEVVTGQAQVDDLLASLGF
jgi:chemotaxis protein CheZ